MNRDVRYAFNLQEMGYEYDWLREDGQESVCLVDPRNHNKPD